MDNILLQHEIIEIFSHNLKFLRKKKSLTQVKLAKILELSRGTLAAWEEKRAIPCLEVLNKIAIYFKTDIIKLTLKKIT